MKMPLFLTAIILSLISVSCSEENQLTEPLREQSSISLSPIKGISYDSNIITKDDAIFVATKFLNRKEQEVKFMMQYLFMILLENKLVM